MLPMIAMLLAAAPPTPTPCPLGVNWGTAPSSTRGRNILSSIDGPLTWNGAPVSDRVLRQYLGNVAKMTPRPELVIDTTGMDCAARRRVAATIDAAGGCTPDVCRAYDVVRGSPPPAPPAPGVPWTLRRR